MFISVCVKQAFVHLSVLISQNVLAKVCSKVHASLFAQFYDSKLTTSVGLMVECFVKVIVVTVCLSITCLVSMCVFA